MNARDRSIRARESSEITAVSSARKASTWRALFFLREKARHQIFHWVRPNVRSVCTLDDFGLAVE
jgi:hypothetical protein